jgi:hypothetical protein
MKYGSHGYDNKSVLDPGNIPVVSSQGVDNGVFGFFDVPKKYPPLTISVPRTGSIGYAFVQHSASNITDDCIVLKPLVEVSTEYLYYIVAMIRNSRWRFNYGRKITPERLKIISVVPPEFFKEDISYSAKYLELYPKPNKTKTTSQSLTRKKFSITDLFDLAKGQFHAIDRLESGDFPTVSRISTDNGIVGFYNKPQKSKVFSAGTLTVSTVTGDTFLQINPFIASDNVLICIPKKNYRISTLIYIQALLNKLKWRYSYGRQPYYRIFEKTTGLTLPIKDGDTLDEDSIENIVKHTKYYTDLLSRIQSS